jgi:hypothetical protein
MAGQMGAFGPFGPDLDESQNEGTQAGPYTAFLQTESPVGPDSSTAWTQQQKTWAQSLVAEAATQAHAH